MQHERSATMSNTNNVFTLEALDEEIERTYAPLKFQAGDDEFVLVSLLRVDGKVRKDVMAKLEELDKAEEPVYDAEGNVVPGEFDEDSTIEALQFILSSVTRDRKGNKLVRVLGPNLVRLMTLLKKWQEATQPGEAQDSPA
jgi:hypothetical protein